MIPEKFRQAHTKPPYGTDRLREAARVLRATVRRVATEQRAMERAEGASVEAEPPWVMKGQRIESYIATMQPGVGLALADWLEHEAEEQDYDPSEHDGSPNAYAVRLADLILGGQS